MRITYADFDRSLHEILGGMSQASLRFDDGTDVYKIRLQRLGGVGRGIIECYCTLNAQDAVQVSSMQSDARAIGDILLDIACAPPGTPANEFFAPECAPTEQWSVGGEGNVRDTALLRKLREDDAEDVKTRQAAGPTLG